MNTVICFYSYMLEVALKISDYFYEPILLKAYYPLSAQEHRTAYLLCEMLCVTAKESGGKQEFPGWFTAIHGREVFCEPTAATALRGTKLSSKHDRKQYREKENMVSKPCCVPTIQCPMPWLQMTPRGYSDFCPPPGK